MTKEEVFEKYNIEEDFKFKDFTSYELVGGHNKWISG
jgi:hypothetical protein